MEKDDRSGRIERDRQNGLELAGSIKIVGVILLFVENDVTMTIANSSEVTVLNALWIEAPRV